VAPARLAEARAFGGGRRSLGTWDGSLADTTYHRGGYDLCQSSTCCSLHVQSPSSCYCLAALHGLHVPSDTYMLSCMALAPSGPTLYIHVYVIAGL